MRRTVPLALFLLILVAALVVTTGQGGSYAEDNVAAEKWEYLVVAGQGSTTSYLPATRECEKKKDYLGARDLCWNSIWIGWVRKAES